MADQSQSNVSTGDRCEVVAGTHRGKTGIVEDLKLSKTGHATITVRQDSGICFKTLARNAQKRG